MRYIHSVSVILLSIACLSCKTGNGSGAGKQATKGNIADNTVLKMEKDTALYTVKAQFKELRHNAPPSVDFITTLSLSNHSGSAKWFLLPNGINLSLPANGALACNTVVIRKLPGTGSVYVYSFSNGENSFAGILLPPHATISINDFPFSVKDGATAFVGADVLVATELTIDHQPVSGFTGKELLVSGTQAAVDYTFSGGEKVLVKSTSEKINVPVHATTESLLHLEIKAQ